MRLISWNIQWCRGCDGRVSPERVAAVLRDHGADVICLQEVAVNHPCLPGMGAGAADCLADQASLFSSLYIGHELAFGVASDLPDGRGGRRQFGNLVISRYPMLQVFRHALPFPADPGRAGMARAALEVTIAAPGGPLRLINTHLEYYSTSQRVAQFRALRRIYTEGWSQALTPMAADDADPPFAVLPRGFHTVVCGDFNAPPEAAENCHLTDAFESEESGAASPAPSLYDAWRHAHGDLPHAATAGLLATPFFSTPICLDRAYISENLLPSLRNVSVDASCQASDHQPLILDIDDLP